MRNLKLTGSLLAVSMLLAATHAQAAPATAPRTLAVGIGKPATLSRIERRASASEARASAPMDLTRAVSGDLNRKLERALIERLKPKTL